ncbi:MAG: Ig-like domain-containing protein [Candidatus Brocadiaceae bacterium]|nr:Ig-like domain-containing protein [Candidatus Brocadiaceae bacterium]
MKKFMVIFVLTFLAVVGLNKYEGVAWAENDVEMGIDLFKYVSSDGESYDIAIEIGGEDVKKVKTATIKIPSGKNMKLKNSLGLDEIGLWASYGSYDEFKKKFPEGEYSITLLPKKYGSLKVDITHDFPETPEITYPEDGATDVSLAPTITWEALNNIDGLFIFIETVEGDGVNKIGCEIELSKDVTSYTIPSGLLQSNTEYDFDLAAKISDGKDNDLFTSRVIRFTTGSE